MGNRKGSSSVACHSSLATVLSGAGKMVKGGDRIPGWFFTTG